MDDMAAIRKAIMTAGPVVLLPTSPDNTYIPAPRVDPTPSVVKSTTVKTRASLTPPSFLVVVKIQLFFYFYSRSNR